MKLSQLFTAHGSDKCTEHSYGRFYDETVTNRNIDNILELGVLEGASIRAWKEAYPKATIVGVDRRAYKYSELLARDINHHSIHILQAETPDYNPVIDYCRLHSLKFDVIVDDGSHVEFDQILGKQVLWEFLKPNGIYVVEDIQSFASAKNMEVLHGAKIVSLLECKGRWDDVIAFWEKSNVS